MPGIQRVRHSVRENRLTWRMIGDGEVVEYLEQRARGWVVEVDGEVVAIGDSETGNIWALFVDPGHERHGHRRRLHDEMVSWLWSRGITRLFLGTQPGTRAQGFYERAGWRSCGLLPSGEMAFEREAPAS